MSMIEHHSTAPDSTAQDTGLLCLAQAAEHFDIAVLPRRLAHRLGREQGAATTQELCRLALWIGLRARVVDFSGEHLQDIPTPALVPGPAGFTVLSKIDAETATIWSPQESVTRQIPLTVFVQLCSGPLLLLGEELESRKRVPFGFRWFLPSILRHTQQFYWVMAISLNLQLIALVSPLFFQSVTDKVLVSRAGDSLQVLAVGLLGLAVVEPIFAFVRSWLFGNLASKVNAELEGRVFGHLMALSLTYFRTRQVGEVIARVREIDHVRQFLTGSALTLVLDLIFVAIFLVVMLWYSVVLTSILVISLIACFAVWMVIGPQLRAQALTTYEQNAQANAFLIETMSGIETLKTCATEERFSAHWQQRLTTYLRSQFRMKRLGITAGQIIAFIQKAMSAIMLWFGVHAVMKGQMTVGELVAFNMWSGHVVEPVLRLAQIWQDFQHTQVALRRVGDILDEPGEAIGEGVGALHAIDGALVFEQVRFRYSDTSPEVLKGLNLDIPPGSFIGVTGPSGSGKSTLARLLQRLYSPQQGQILVDGGDIAIADPIELRRQMSIVPQESMLFAGTVADNIRLCKPDATNDEVQAAAKLAGAHGFVVELPEGYATDVGERGGFLSGGQRQRIALARALITDPRILILDEATSALDYESEAAIMARLPEIIQGRTVVSIAHRLNTLRPADRILVMEDGTITESGSHEHLLKLNGRYAKLWALQTGEGERTT
ncbi:type I secretion system permease/ATPase [Pseudomonas chlororaphis]|uniref:type I secretion system permease/ATPase n=1 Tax=Pseudomonas chlororaphis TaxID=587753 RepID=UPI001C60E9BD|nr:type I secretion system permease/ATPase [Pseudomonas chlororaphis]